MKVVLVVHGARRRAKIAAKEILHAAPGAWEPVVQLTQRSGESELLAAEAVDRQCGMIVSVGGDGTLNGCVNGMMCAQRDRHLPSLAVYPAGSGNDFARSLQVPSGPRQWLQWIEQARTMLADVIEVVGAAERKYFINNAETGLSSVVIGRAESWQPWIGNSAAYALAIASVLIRRPKARISCRVNAFEHSQKLASVVAANGRFFAGGLNIAPHARLDDGLMDVVLIRQAGLADLARHWSDLRAGRRVDNANIRYARTDRLSIEGPGQLEFDGELGPSLPLTLRVVPQAIPLVAQNDQPADRSVARFLPK